MKNESYTCDIHKCTNEAEHKQQTLQVIFTTDQTEGRSVKPYLSIEKIDICQSCLDKILKGNYVFANGAMGYNEYNLSTK